MKIRLQIVIAASFLLAAAPAAAQRNSIGLSGGIQGDASARYGVDANAAIEYRRVITRTLSFGIAVPADVTTGERRAIRLILEDPSVSLGLGLFALRVNGRPVVIGGIGAACDVRSGEEGNNVRLEGVLVFPIPTRPRWTIDVSMGRQFRAGDRPSRYAALGISRAF